MPSALILKLGSWLAAANAAVVIAAIDSIPIYTPVPASERSPGRNQFEVFNPATIPNRYSDDRPQFQARLVYSTRDWSAAPPPAERRRLPRDPLQFQHTVLLHKSVPVSMAVTFERVDAPYDADPATLTKILRYTREAHAKFRVIKETPRRIGGVDGIETEYTELHKKELWLVRHWLTHYNGVVCQLELMVPYENRELLQIGGSTGYPLLLEFYAEERQHSVLKDADVPRTFESPYGYRVNLGAGDWVPGVSDRFIPLAEYVAYTRNQGGIAIVPVGTFGQAIEAPALLRSLAVSVGLLDDRSSTKLQTTRLGGLGGIAYETLVGDEEETIRMQVRTVANSSHAYLLAAWINTNAPVPVEPLEQWFNKVTFVPSATPHPAGAKDLRTMREKDRHAITFLTVGEYCYAKGDFAPSAAALRSALECRFLPDILAAFVQADLQRGQPEQTLAYLNDCGPIALRQPWMAMELAFTKSRLGQYADALFDYTRCISSGGYTAATFPARRFEDYVRCLAHEGRTKWATDRLQERLRDDASPVWPQMLEQLKQNKLPAPSAPSALAGFDPPNAGSSSVSVPAAQIPIRVQAPSPEPETGPPSLRGIIWNPRQPSAQVGGKVVFEGDSVRGYKVQRIRQDGVDLLAPDGGQLTLTLKQ